MSIRPKPYQNPPAPIRLDRRTLRASAFSAPRTRALNGVGIVKSAKLLPENQTRLEGQRSPEDTHETMRMDAIQMGTAILLSTLIYKNKVKLKCGDTKAVLLTDIAFVPASEMAHLRDVHLKGAVYFLSFSLAILLLSMSRGTFVLTWFSARMESIE